MLGSLILYLKGMRTIMFQLSGYYYSLRLEDWAPTRAPSLSGTLTGMGYVVGIWEFPTIRGTLGFP